jgi:hypothetical protein
MPLTGAGLGSGLGLESVTHFHQREAQQVETRPLFWRHGPLIIGGQPDTPDRVPRRGLDDDPVAGAEQELAQAGVLAELGQVAGDDQVDAVLCPALLIEPADLPAQRLGCSRVRCLAYPRSRFRIAEQRCLARHHEVLSGRIAVAVNGERRRPPLAQAPLSHATCWRRLVSPEQQVPGPRTAPDEAAQLVSAARIGCARRHAALLPDYPGHQHVINHRYTPGAPERSTGELAKDNLHERSAHLSRAHDPIRAGPLPSSAR